jgi:threonyl-tRNA synthetase
MIIPISEASVGYARKVRASLRAAKLHVEVDISDKKMQKKVREAQLAQFNYILVSLLPEPALDSPLCCLLCSDLP